MIDRRQTLALTVILLACGSIVGCGASEASSSDGPEIVDLQQGEFRGVRLGDSHDRVRRILGRPLGRPDQDWAPVGVDGTEAGFPFTISPPRRPTADYERVISSMPYRDVGFHVERRAGVYVMAITAENAITREGVGIGDDLRDIGDRFPGLECGISEARVEDSPRPFCSGRIRRGVHVWFGQDPVRSILIAGSGFL